MNIIDFHCHLDINGSIDHLNAIQDKFGVDISVIHPGFDDFRNLSTYHENIKNILREGTDTFKAFIGIDFKNKPEAIADIFHEIGASGVKIHPILQGIEIHNKEFMAPFMAVLKQLDAPVYVHTDHPGVPNYRKYRTLLKSRFGRFAKKFPDQGKLIMGHAGNNDSYLDAKHVFKLRGNTYVETSLAPVPSEFEKMINRVEGGENRILFGSNVQYCSFEVELKKIHVLNITEKQKQKILFENAKRLLKL